MLKKVLIYTLYFLIIIFFIFKSICLWNMSQLFPTNEEIILLKKFYGDISVKDSTDLIKIQNFTESNLKLAFIGDKEVKINEILNQKKGLCYDRSILLQKILLYNGFKIRPVYLFFNEKNNKTSYFDLLSRRTLSHSVFEIYWKTKWVVMRTNHQQVNFESLEQYIQNSNIIPKETLFIRHLNNRNGRFIYPGWIPDIY